MGRGTCLNLTETQCIGRMRSEGCSISQIARLLGRSRKVIHNYLADPENYGRNYIPCKKYALSNRDERALLREASNSASTTREIAVAAGITNVQKKLRTCQRRLAEAQHLQRKRLKRKPGLQKRHREARLAFAKRHVTWKKRWRTVIFTDEKRFCLDGPDGFRYYFHDLRKDELFSTRRQQGGGGVMVWGGVGYRQRTNIRFVSGRMNSNDYLKLVDEEVIHSTNDRFGNNYIFQQDNAAIHTARKVKEYFERNSVQTLDWPALSPDLNIIENVWGHLSRIVYQGGRQYANVEELKDAIRTTWDRLPKKYIKSLFKSLRSRMLEVIEKQGGHTHY